MRGRSAFLSAASAWIALWGCGDPVSGSGPGSDSDLDSDSDSDSDSDTDSDSDADGDTDYPDGPYGFDPSMELDTDMSSPGAWTGDGDVIPNVCLGNAEGGQRCLGELYRSPDVDLLFVDFTTMW